MTSNSQTKVCLTLISGMPAAGKTTLANLFCECIDSMPFDLQVCDKKGRLRVVNIAYDKLIPVDLNLTEDTNVSTWKQYREQIHICLDRLLDSFISGRATLLGALNEIKESNVVESNDPAGHVKSKFCEILRHQLKEESSNSELPVATVFLVDDNFFYRSMRYEYYQMARKYSISFCEVHISCPVNVAMCRNAHRPSPISMETYKNMLAKMEEPGSSRLLWETNYLIIDGECEFNHMQLSQMWGLIYDALQDPVQPLAEEDLEAKEQSRTVTLTNVLHQADIILRKCVSESISKAKEGGPAVEIKSFATKANLGKTTLLDRIREGVVVLPPLDTKLDSGPSKKFEDQLRKLFDEFLQTT